MATFIKFWATLYFSIWSHWPAYLKQETGKVPIKKYNSSIHEMIDSVKLGVYVLYHFAYIYINHLPTWAVVVAQLAEWSLLAPVVRSSNPVIGKIYIEHC